MKRFVTRLAALATVGAAAGLASTATAQPGAPAPQSQPSQRICIVNIAKVLRDYNKANFQGQQITEKRQAYVVQVNALREKAVEINKLFQTSMIPDEKKKYQEQALAIQRQVEDIDRKAQAELTQLSNTTIVAVYQEIKSVIKEIAEANNLAMVLCYPAASKPEDEASPQVAQLMLQTPAMIPFYHRNMDITEVVVKTLNARNPAPEVKPVSNTVPAPAPGGVTKTPGGM